MNLLEGKVALITGASRGIGKAIAIAFAKQGASIAFTDMRRDELMEDTEREIQALGVKAIGYASDASSFTDSERAADEIAAEFGRIDILFNNAGIVIKGTAETTSESDWAQTLAINVTAVWRMCRLVIPEMRRVGGGVIVNNGSDWAVVGGKG